MLFGNDGRKKMNADNPPIANRQSQIVY